MTDLLGAWKYDFHLPRFMLINGWSSMKTHVGWHLTYDWFHDRTWSVLSCPIPHVNTSIIALTALFSNRVSVFSTRLSFLRTEMRVFTSVFLGTTEQRLSEWRMDCLPVPAGVNQPQVSFPAQAFALAVALPGLLFPELHVIDSRHSDLSSGPCWYPHLILLHQSVSSQCHIEFSSKPSQLWKFSNIFTCLLFVFHNSRELIWLTHYYMPVPRRGTE